MDKGWTVEQLAAKLKTTKATIYRHINKLKEMDLLDEVNVNERGTIRKGYRIRYGNLSKAWNFVESNVQIAMENYRKTVDHVQNLSQERRKPMAENEYIVLTKGSRYRITSMETRDKPLITHGIFRGYAAIGPDDGGCME